MYYCADSVMTHNFVCHVYIHAVALIDYGAVSTILRFSACETRRCVDITIVDDTDIFDELSEAFIITMERTPGLNDGITLDPTNGLMMIIDDEGEISVFGNGRASITEK